MDNSNLHKDIEYRAVSKSEENITKNEKNPDKWKIWKKRRYVVALLSCLGLCCCSILKANISIAVVAMTANRTIIGNDGNITHVKDFNWNSKMKGFLLSSFFYGYITTTLLGGWLAPKIGGKRVFGIGIGVAGLLALPMPFAATRSYYFALTLRVLAGMFEGVTFPCVHAIWSKWAPPLERTKLASITFSGSFLGTFVAMPFCAYFAQKLGWESVFYSSGGLTLLWFVCWWVFVAETPSDDRFITNAELKYIKVTLGDQNVDANIKHPWKSILTSIPVLACGVAHFAENWGYYTMVTHLPTFMEDVLHFNLSTAGILSAMPYLAITIILQVSGHIADYLRSKKILTTTQVRKLFCCFAFSAQALFLLLVAFILSPKAVIICLTLGVGLGGFACSGFAVNHLDIAPQHASILFGITNVFGVLPGLVSPALTGYIVTTASSEEWRLVFFIASGVYLAGAILYGIMASGELQPWAAQKSDPLTLSPVEPLII